MHISDVLFTGVIYGSRVNTVLFFISISCELVNKVYINVCVCAPAFVCVLRHKRCQQDFLNFIIDHSNELINVVTL